MRWSICAFVVLSVVVVTSAGAQAAGPKKTRPAPPMITWPSDGDAVLLDDGLAFKINPYVGATKYSCTLIEGRHQWTTSTEVPECQLAPTDPRHAKFTEGKASFVARALVDGVWSTPAKIALRLAKP